MPKTHEISQVCLERIRDDSVLSSSIECFRMPRLTLRNGLAPVLEHKQDHLLNPVVHRVKTARRGAGLNFVQIVVLSNRIQPVDDPKLPADLGDFERDSLRIASSGNTGKRPLRPQAAAEILVVVKTDKVDLPVKFG